MEIESSVFGQLWTNPPLASWWGKPVSHCPLQSGQMGAGDLIPLLDEKAELSIPMSSSGSQKEVSEDQNPSLQNPDPMTIYHGPWELRDPMYGSSVSLPSLACCSPLHRLAVLSAPWAEAGQSAPTGHLIGGGLVGCPCVLSLTAGLGSLTAFSPLLWCGSPPFFFFFFFLIKFPSSRWGLFELSGSISDLEFGDCV